MKVDNFSFKDMMPNNTLMFKHAPIILNITDHEGEALFC